jgi:hypothetical protein
VALLKNGGEQQETANGGLMGVCQAFQSARSAGPHLPGAGIRCAELRPVCRTTLPLVKSRSTSEQWSICAEIMALATGAMWADVGLCAAQPRLATAATASPAVRTNFAKVFIYSTLTHFPAPPVRPHKQRGKTLSLTYDTETWESKLGQSDCARRTAGCPKQI